MFSEPEFQLESDAGEGGQMAALRALRLPAGLVAVVLLAAACTTGGVGTADEEVTQALDQLNVAVGQIAAEADALHTSAHDLSDRLAAVEELQATLQFDFARVGPSRATFIPNPPAGQVAVQFIAEVVDAAFPGEFKFYLAPEGAQLFDTVSLPAGEAIETGPELVDGLAFVDPGVLYTLQVVFENPTDEEIRFLVPGGTLDPQAALPYVRNLCWCAAVPFSAPAGGTFSRVIQVGVGPDTPPGAKAVMVWPVAALDQ
ncbi:MAG: hypothetical protein ACE5MI_09955 [Acidimicrobiia bacterium]